MNKPTCNVPFNTFRLETLDFLSAMKDVNDGTSGHDSKFAGFKEICKKYDMGETLTFTDTYS